MIVIQQIRSKSWDASSVGPGSERNGVPEAMELPRYLCDGKDGAVLQHLWSLTDISRRSSPEGRVLTQTDRSPIKLGCVTVHPGEGAAQVSFAWDYRSGGAPARWWAEKSFDLRSGVWARIIYNGRFSGESCWWYEKTVVNVGVFDSLSADLFTRGELTYRYELFSRLC
jgi:hypothetical protein